MRVRIEDETTVIPLWAAPTASASAPSAAAPRAGSAATATAVACLPHCGEFLRIAVDKCAAQLGSDAVVRQQRRSSGGGAAARHQSQGPPALAAVSAFTFHPSQFGRAALGLSDGTVYGVDLQGGQLFLLGHLDSAVTTLTFASSPFTHWLLCGTAAQEAYILSWETGRREQRWFLGHVHRQLVRGMLMDRSAVSTLVVCWSPDAVSCWSLTQVPALNQEAPDHHHSDLAGNVMRAMGGGGAPPRSCCLLAFTRPIGGMPLPAASCGPPQHSHTTTSPDTTDQTLLPVATEEDDARVGCAFDAVVLIGNAILTAERDYLTKWEATSHTLHPNNSTLDNNNNNNSNNNHNIAIERECRRLPHMLTVQLPFSILCLGTAGGLVVAVEDTTTNNNSNNNNSRKTPEGSAADRENTTSGCEKSLRLAILDAQTLKGVHMVQVCGEPQTFPRGHCVMISPLQSTNTTAAASSAAGDPVVVALSFSSGDGTLVEMWTGKTLQTWRGGVDGAGDHSKIEKAHKGSETDGGGRRSSLSSVSSSAGAAPSLSLFAVAPSTFAAVATPHEVAFVHLLTAIQTKAEDLNSTTRGIIRRNSKEIREHATSPTAEENSSSEEDEGDEEERMHRLCVTPVGRLPAGLEGSSSGRGSSIGHLVKGSHGGGTTSRSGAAASCTPPRLSSPRLVTFVTPEEISRRKKKRKKKKNALSHAVEESPPPTSIMRGELSEDDTAQQAAGEALKSLAQVVETRPSLALSITQTPLQWADGSCFSAAPTSPSSGGKADDRETRPRGGGGVSDDKATSLQRVLLGAMPSPERPLSAYTPGHLAVLQQQYHKLRTHLRRFGIFPALHRPTVWRFALGLPHKSYTAPLFASLARKPLHHCVPALMEAYPLPPSKEELKIRIEQTISVMAWHAPVFGILQCLPAIIYPFAHVLHDPQTLMEVLLIFFLNWGKDFFSFHPQSPPEVMTFISQLLRREDAALWNHFELIRAPAEVWGWEVLQVVYTDALTANEWMQLMDHALLMPPLWLFVFHVALLKEERTTLLGCSNAVEVLEALQLGSRYTSRPGSGFSISRVLQEAHRVYHACQFPSSPTTQSVVPSEVYADAPGTVLVGTSGAAPPTKEDNHDGWRSPLPLPGPASYTFFVSLYSAIDVENCGGDDGQKATGGVERRCDTLVYPRRLFRCDADVLSRRTQEIGLRSQRLREMQEAERRRVAGQRQAEFDAIQQEYAMHQTNNLWNAQRDAAAEAMRSMLELQQTRRSIEKEFAGSSGEAARPPPRIGGGTAAGGGGGVGVVGIPGLQGEKVTTIPMSPILGSPPPPPVTMPPFSSLVGEGARWDSHNNNTAQAALPHSSSRGGGDGYNSTPQGLRRGWEAGEEGEEEDEGVLSGRDPNYHVAGGHGGAVERPSSSSSPPPVPDGEAEDAARAQWFRYSPSEMQSLLLQQYAR